MELTRNNIQIILQDSLQKHNKILIDWGYNLFPEGFRDEKNEPGKQIKYHNDNCHRCWCCEQLLYSCQVVVKENTIYRMYEWLIYCFPLGPLSPGSRSIYDFTPVEDYFKGWVLEKIAEGKFSRYRPIKRFIYYDMLSTEIKTFAKKEETEYNNYIKFLDHNDELKNYAEEEEQKDNEYAKKIESKIFDTIPNQ